MLELNIAATTPRRTRLAPGVYAFVWPEMEEHVVAPDNGVDAFLQGLPSLLRTQTPLAAGEQILLPQHGGLISNLRVWENILLPRWYHTGQRIDGFETELLDQVKRLLPQIEDPAEWVHQTVGKLEQDEVALVGLLRVLLSPARLVWIEADWHFRLSMAQRQVCATVLQEFAQQREAIVLVFADNKQAQESMQGWSAMVATINWESL